MTTRSLLMPFVVTLLFACNNSATEEKKAEEPAAASHDSMQHHMDAAVAVVPVPEIPAGARVYFKNLKNGASVVSPFKVEMGVENLSVDSANGKVKAGSGHHHILINSGDSLAMGTVVPKDSLHLHFGNAQTETEMKLPPGKYHLTLQFADALHRSYGGRLTSSINITVKK